MYIRHSAKFNKEIKIIHPGEFYVSLENEFIGTLLGSCIAVCLIDLVAGIAGMNHFMLPGRISTSDIFSDRAARYGVVAINHLLIDIENKGAKRVNLKAKIFGGGHVLEAEAGLVRIPNDNIRVARAMMEMEDIPIIDSDVGENYTRKILMDVKTGKVFLKKTTRLDVVASVNKRDIEFVKRRLINEKN